MNQTKLQAFAVQHSVNNYHFFSFDNHVCAKISLHLVRDHGFVFKETFVVHVMHPQWMQLQLYQERFMVSPSFYSQKVVIVLTCPGYHALWNLAFSVVFQIKFVLLPKAIVFWNPFSDLAQSFSCQSLWLANSMVNGQKLIGHWSAHRQVNGFWRMVSS